MKPKPTPHYHYQRALLCAGALATLIALPHQSVGADDSVTVKTDSNGLVAEEKLSVGAAPAPPLSAEEVTALSDKMRTGFKVPRETFLRMRPATEDILQKLPRGEDVVYRMNGDNVYALDPKSYVVLEVVQIEVKAETTARPIDSSSTVSSMEDRSTTTLKKGEVVPAALMASMKRVPVTTAARLPAVQNGTFYAWLDGAMYQVKATQYTVIDRVRGEREDTSATDSAAAVETPTMTVEQMVAVKKALVKGNAVPEHHYPLLIDVPTPVSERLPVVEGAEYRYLDGVVYTLDPKTREIIETATVEEITGRE